ncbi:unnamed protein product [Ixodes persulcatus]
MSKSDRKTGEPHDAKDDADKATALLKSASAGDGARPRSSRPSIPKTSSKSRTSAPRRGGGGGGSSGGDGKFARASAAATSFLQKADKSGAFNSLLKRAQRRRGGDNAGDRSAGKQVPSDGSDCNERADVSGDKVVEKIGHVKNQSRAVASAVASAAATVDTDDTAEDVVAPRIQVRRSKTEDDVAEYTILTRPSKQGAYSSADASTTASPVTHDVVYEHSQEVPGPFRDPRCKGKIRHGPSGRPDYHCSDTCPRPPFSYSGSQPETCPIPFSSPYDTHPISPMFPMHASNEELPYPRYDTAFIPQSFPSSPQYFPYPLLPPPPSPAMSPSYPPIVVPPSPSQSFWTDRYGPPNSRRRSKSSCYTRRLPEGRLYDSHGRWIGNESKQPGRGVLIAECTPCEICGEEELQKTSVKEGFVSSGSGQELANNRTRTLQNFARRHSSASWSPSTVPEDDIEDLLPLIDQLAIEYPTSDSSTESAAEPQMPEEDAWFSVLPETTRPEDRFIWSPRRDLHRPKSIWSPIKPRLGSCPDDSLKEALARMKYRSRTYTENFSSRNPESPVEGRRRAISCELPRSDREARDEFQPSGVGWSPWSCQLPTADSLNK